MCATKNPKGRAGQKIKRKVFKLVVVVAVVLVILAFFLFPMFVSSEKGRGVILSRISRSIEGSMDIGNLSMGWSKGIELEDFSFNDAAGLIFFSAKKIAAKPHYLAILFGNLSFGKTIIDQPRIIINLEQRPKKQTEVPKLSTVERPQVLFPIKQIDLEVKAGTADINLTSQDKSVRNLKISDIQSRIDLKPPGKTSSFDIAMELGDTETSNISAKGSLKPPATKSWSLRGTTGDFTVNINELDLASLTPLFALAGKDVQAAGKLNADIEVNIDDGRFNKLQADAVLSGFKKKIDGKEVFVDEPVKINAKIQSDEKAVTIEKLNIESSFCRLDCKGDAEQIDYILNADLKGVQEFAGQFVSFSDYKIKGSISAKGKAIFDEKMINANGQSTINELVLSDAKTVTPSTSAQISFDVSADTDKDLLTVRAAKITADPGEVRIADALVPLSSLSSSELAMDVSANLDLQKLKPFAVLFASLPEEMEIAGIAESKLNITSQKNAYRVVTNSTKITNLKILSPGQEPFDQNEVTLVLDASIDPAQKSVSVEKLELISPQIKILKGKFNKNTKKGKTNLTGQLDCEYDWSAVGAVAAPFLPEGLKLQGKRKDTINFTSEYPATQPDKMLANLNTSGKIGFEQAEYMGMFFGATEIEMQVKKGLLEISPFSTVVNNGQFNFAANADFNTKPTLLKTPGPVHIVKSIQINDETSRKLLMYVNPLFANAVNVSGIADFHCEKLAVPLAADNKEDIEVVGTIAIEKLHLESSDLLGQILTAIGINRSDAVITLRPTNFILRDGMMRYDNMQMDIDDVPVNFKGIIGLDGKLDMNVTLPYTLKGKTTRVDKESAGQRITLPLKGTVNKPEIDFGKLFEIQTKQLLEDEAEKLIRKGLEELFK